MKNGFRINLVAVLFASLVLSAAAPTWAAETKIGVVDMQKALQTVDAGKKARTELEKEFNAKKKDLDGEQEKLKKMDEEFKKQSLALSEEAKSKKQREFQEKYMKFQEMAQKSQMEIQKRESELTAPLVDKMRGVIGEIAKEKSYSIILEKNNSSVLFFKDSDDVTAEVIETFNKKNKS